MMAFYANSLETYRVTDQNTKQEVNMKTLIYIVNRYV
jgi:hypothetical protein